MNTIVESYRAGLFQKKYWLQNIISGLIVGVVALPLAMAFAIASGAKPEQGLYTAIVAGLIVSIMGGSRVQIAGPTGAFIVVLSGITAQYGIPGLQIATLMAGFILVLFGFARLGTIIKFIPSPVIIGFTSGIAVVIWVGQWQYFFGLPATGNGHFHEKFWHLLQSFPHLNIATTFLGICALIIVLYSSKLPGLKRIPGPLVALVLVTIIQSLAHFEGVATIGSLFGGIPQGLPAFTWPDITMARLIELTGPAFAIAMLGAIESLLSAVVADGMSGTRHHSNRELVGQGIANIVAPLFGGFAATGAIARTATNIRNGGNNPLAGIIHSITLILVLLFLAPLAVDVPLAALAAILFVVSWNMSEARHFIKLIRVAPRADVVILLVTFCLTVFVDLVVAVNVGVIIAVLHFLRRMVNSIQIQRMSEGQLSQEMAQEKNFELPEGVMVYVIEGPFFFGAVETFQSALANTYTDPGTLIIRMRWVPFIDVTGLQAMEEIILNLQKRGVRVLLSEANPLVEAKLRKMGIVQLLGEQNFYKEFSQALDVCQINDANRKSQSPYEVAKPLASVAQ
ncbi:SulP family inorganic anion transporter [Legionella pneumophila]|uniref:Sulfate permease n=1 Tax=Legionella pneumophila subsp. pascullei TaxID=91890 RepID=A0AAX2ITE2_LEGPN|nr:sulfate permease [Legionella pneumophila]HAT9116993.1 sulfate permease [Legionella pneumophila subsp. pneumophila]AMP90492.1 sodium-independent anion transporter [Legionella pneumophila subsp. pascullei]AMP91839.1 sulfate transporter [Legionella pneumophila subsp. pascullei]AMP94805.1 sulfate transporter [Legionella pneumophila subsp. pascullei]APF05650.1 sodium-independent anion transporter [Legionella pneumophila subsp. fraseri]